MYHNWLINQFDKQFKKIGITQEQVNICLHEYSSTLTEADFDNHFLKPKLLNQLVLYLT